MKSMWTSAPNPPSSTCGICLGANPLEMMSMMSFLEEEFKPANHRVVSMK